MSWATLETEGDRPPLKMWSRQELDHLADGAFGVRRRTTRRASHLQPGEVRAIAKSYREGASLNFLSHRFNRHPKTIEKALRMEGVTVGGDGDG